MLQARLDYENYRLRETVEGLMEEDEEEEKGETKKP